jgi:hypothetical protein
MSLIEEKVDLSAWTDGSTIGEGKDSPSCLSSPKISLPLCLEATVLGESGMDQWVTQVPPSQTDTGNTSSLARNSVFGPPSPPKHLGKLGITPFESLYGHLILTNDPISGQ